MLPSTPCRYSRSLRLLSIFSAFASASVAQAADVTATINWGTTTGRTASLLHFGQGLFQGFIPGVAGTPGDAAYKANVAYMKPGLIRYHHGEQMTAATTNNRGWIVDPTVATPVWDTAKITNALNNAYNWSPAPTVLMNIVNWPSSMNHPADAAKTNKRLDPAKYNAYATLCAQLVQHVNITLSKGVEYWEITNEKDEAYDGTEAQELADIYKVCSAAMKAVDSSIKTGAPAYSRPEDSANVNGFISRCTAIGVIPNFISYHQYPNFSDTSTPPAASDAAIWSQAAAIGSFTTNIKAAFPGSWSAVETFHDEHNITWRSNDDARMKNIKGAIWDALAMISIVNAGATAACAWNESDDRFGKLESSSGGYALRPAAHLWQMFTTDMTGTVVANSSSNTSQLVSFATTNGSWKKFCLINRSGVAKTVRINFSGWTTIPSSSTSFSFRRISGFGYTTGNTTYGTLISTGGFTLPADSVTTFSKNGF
jgi:Glycosyl hydrolases family 39